MFQLRIALSNVMKMMTHLEINITRKHILFVLSLLALSSIYSQSYDCEISGDDYIFISPKMVKEKTLHDSVYMIYNYSVVRDSVLMNLIVEATNDVINNDSLYHLIKSEYFPNWDRSATVYNRIITVNCQDQLPLNDEDINDRFIPDGFDKSILYNKLITISVWLSFYDWPFAGYYTVYNGIRYYFANTLLITPTQKQLKVRISTDIDINDLFNYIALQFFYYNGVIYLNPTIDVWNCY